ncbi:MAG: M1 family aminopeptidase [Calditrichia bacterium]
MKNLIVMLLLGMIFNFQVYSASAQPSKIAIQKHHLKLEIDPDAHFMEIVAVADFQCDESIFQAHFFINRKAEIISVQLNQEPINFTLSDSLTQLDSDTDHSEYKNVKELVVRFPEPTREGRLHFHYKLTADDPVDQAAFSREYIAYEVKGYVGEKGVFLSPAYFWYPQEKNGFKRFLLETRTPEWLYIVTEGTLLQDSVANGKRNLIWEVDYPGEGIHLVGSRYDIQQTHYKNIDITTYFFPESRDLAKSYLEASQRYIAMYEKLIGPYPFSKFAVIENFFPTGYGMPSFTLLGSRVIRLPFIIYTSLGHEVAHNWWGNSVYVDYESGNWCEGLTTYFADYYYKEMKDPQEAMLYRRDLNRDYSVYVKNGRDFPLSEFKERTESASRAIGYGKSAMTFHQLRKIIGDSLFYQSFREFYRQNRFRKASWKDIQNAVEKVSKQDLGWFFSQWVEREGAPKLKLIDARYTAGRLTFTLQQEEPTYRLYIPIEIRLKEGTISHPIWMERKSQIFEIPLDRKPLSLAVDPAFDLFRRLDRDEIPPTLSEIFAADTAWIILPDRADSPKFNTYHELAESLVEGKESIAIKKIEEVTPEQLRAFPLYLLGTPAENSLIGKMQLSPQSEVQISDTAFRIGDHQLPQSDDLSVVVFRDEADLAHNICILSMGDGQKMGRVGALLWHYGKYSYLNFTGGKNSLKGIYEVHSSPLVKILE